MNCSPTITAEEFKQLHNGLCDLRHAIDRLDGVLSPEIFKLLTKAKEQIYVGLVGAYAQEDAAYESRSNHYEDVGKSLDLKSIWSLHEVDNLLDRHPYEGADRVVYKNHWGRKTVSVSINGLTWAALWVAADACIRDSGDNHHVFIEGFHPSDEDPRTLILSTGS